MKTMWKKAIGIICAGGLSLLSLTGCGETGNDQSQIPVEEINLNPDKGTDDKTMDAKGTDGEVADTEGTGEFYDGADLEGSVVAFSDEGLSLSPATTETVAGGGEVMAQAAPGAESDENHVQISYSDHTVFQIVNLSMSSQKEISREDTDKESVKKQSQVCVFGSCQDAAHWTADKILILKWQE